MIWRWRFLLFSFLFLFQKSYKEVRFLFFPLIIVGILFFLFWERENLQSLEIEINWRLIILTLLLLFPTYLRNQQKAFKKKEKIFKESLIILFMVLFLLFSLENFMWFFILFEISAIPIILIIFLGGRAKRKGEASLFLFIFTRFRAFFLLSFLSFFSLINRGDLSLISSAFSFPRSSSLSHSSFFFSRNGRREKIIFLVVLTFFVKIPVFFTHMWLPKAHVEAPVFGSIVLARIILKLGGYGFFLIKRFLWKRNIMLYCSLIPIYLSLLAAFAAFGEKDLKVIIALSRVNHITFVLLGLVRIQSQALWGSLLLILGHGVVSSLIFFLRRKNYRTVRSRRLFFSKRNRRSFIFSIFWIIIIFVNRGFPPFLNFLGEIRIIKIFNQNFFFLIFCLLNFIVIGLYGVLLLRKLRRGKLRKTSFILQGSGGEWNFTYIRILHLSILLLLGFFPLLWIYLF